MLPCNKVPVAVLAFVRDSQEVPASYVISWIHEKS